MNFEFLIDEYLIVSAVESISTDMHLFESFCNTISAPACRDGKRFLDEDLWKQTVHNENLSQHLFCTLFGSAASRDEALLLQKYIDSCMLISRNSLPDIGHATMVGQFLNLKPKAGLVSHLDYSQEIWWKESYLEPVLGADKVMHFSRELALVEISDSDTFWQYSGYLFDNLYFCNKSSGIEELGLQFAESFPVAIRHMAYLNDEAQTDFSCDPASFTAVAAAKGVILSAESPNTHRNKSAMRSREVAIGSSSVVCEWHTKIRPQIGRIHFHIGLNVGEDLSKYTKGKVVVGIFAPHLET